MSTTTQNLGLIQPDLSEKHGATTYKANNAIIDQAYGEYLTDYSNSLENIAPIEGSTASANYSVGQYLIKDGCLYRVTAAIANGDSITVGTNVLATSLNEAVASLNNTVASINNAIGTVNVATDGNLQSQVSALRDSISYHKGETIRFGTQNQMFVGRVGWAGKEIYFSVFLDKPIGSDVSSAQVSSTGSGAIYACTADNAVNIKSSIGSWLVAPSLCRSHLSVRWSFTTAPLSINDGVVNIMIDTAIVLTLS